MIFKQLSEQLGHLGQLLSQLTPQDYAFKSKYLSNSSIGGHTRHILELLGCAVCGYQCGLVDYQNRERDLLLEHDIDRAMMLTERLKDAVKLPDKAIKVVHDDLLVDTSYYREVVYNIEHTIHHLALIKVALVEIGVYDVGPNFGMAYSTIKYKQEKVAI